MKILSIFDNCLYGVLWDDEPAESFRMIFSLWNDTQYLFNFFSFHKKELESGYWGKISVDEAVIKTIREAREFERKFTEMALQSPGILNGGIEALFTQLGGAQTISGYLRKSKAKKGWLRIYGLRVDKNIYIITGGAIKLTDTMQRSHHTKKELAKLEMCRSYLLEEGVTEKEGIEDFEI